MTKNGRTEQLMRELDDAIASESVMNALNRKLKNDSETTDYDMWREGSRRFADENPDLLNFS